MGIQFLNQLQHLGEVVNVGGNDDSIAAMIGHHPDATHEIADFPGTLAITTAHVFRLASKPWKIEILLAVLFERRAVLTLPLVLLIVLLWLGILGIRWVDGTQGGRAALGKEHVETVGYRDRLSVFERDAKGAFAIRGRRIELFQYLLDRQQILLGVRGEDNRIRIGLTGDADLAVKASDVSVGGRLRRLIIKKVRALLGLLEKQFVENLLDIDSAHVLERINAGCQGFPAQPVRPGP